MLLANTGATPATAAGMRAQLDAKRFDVVPWYELADFYNKTVALFSKQVSVMKFIIALIIVLSISNTQTMSVLERTSEIGTSMALGVTRAQTLRRFLLESLVIGLVGGLIGLALGMLLAKLISIVGIPMPPPPGMAERLHRADPGDLGTRRRCTGARARHHHARGDLPGVEGLTDDDRRRAAARALNRWRGPARSETSFASRRGTCDGSGCAPR